MIQSLLVTVRDRIFSETVRKALRVLLIVVITGGTAVWFGERLQPHALNQNGGMFWQEGHGPWATDYGRCAGCGEVLVPRVDMISACRHCQRCNASYRHPDLPKSLEEQELIWK